MRGQSHESIGVVQFTPLGEYGGHEGADFTKLVLREGLVVLTRLILNMFYFGWCYGLEKADFGQISHLVGMVVFTRLNFVIFHFDRVWSLGKD